MGKREVEKFLSYLATHGKVAASTQRQALNAIVFLYKHVLDIQIEGLIEHTRSKKHPRPPVSIWRKMKCSVFSPRCKVFI